MLNFYSFSVHSVIRQFSSNSRTPQIYSNMKQMSIGAQESSTRQTRDESNKRLMPPPPTPNHVRQVQVINESPARKLATSQTSRVINNGMLYNFTFNPALNVSHANDPMI